MALQNPKLFGYEIKAALTDVSNKSLALRRLNLPPFDLEVIRGSVGAGMKQTDWRSFHRLSVPIVKSTSRYTSESGSYLSIITNRAGTNSILFGNLDINGSISGKAIRYNYVDFSDSNKVKIADISTSRVSAWSSSDARATNPDLSIQGNASISYGAQVGIATAISQGGGDLVFGTQGSTKTVDGVTYNDCLGPRLQTNMTPQAKEFNSEIPTHKIKVKLGTTDVWLYAMKGIPYTLKGFFRNIDSTVQLTSFKKDGNNNDVAASWKVVETANSNRFVNFPDKGGLTSTIQFRSPVSRERFIHFYYDPDNIKSIQVTSANIAELPQVRLANAQSFNLSSNQLKNFPDFNFLTPSLNTLNLYGNPLYLSETESERNLNPSILNKIPTGVTSLVLGNTFYGSIRNTAELTSFPGAVVSENAGSDIYTSKDLIVRRLPNLSYLNLGRGGGAYFYPQNVNGIDQPAVMPNVSSTMTDYRVYSNDFRTVGATRSDNGSNSHFPNGSYNFADAPNLQALRVYGNWYLSWTPGGIMEIESPSINYIDIGSTGLPLPSCVGKTALTQIHASWCYNAFSMFTNSYTGINQGGSSTSDANTKKSQSGYKFSGCDSLTTLSLSYANLKNDTLPEFDNPNLESIWLYSTSIRGGPPDGTETNVITDDTFKNSENVRNIQIRSGNLLTNGFSTDCFKPLPNLSYLYYYSYGRTGGNLPDFTGNGNLSYLWLHGNAFSGAIPSFTGCNSLYYIRLSDNNLSNEIPGFSNLPSLQYLFLYNNNFTSLGTFSGLGSLYRFEAHNNNISGTIPDFTACSNLYYLILFNNNFNAYTTGSFVDLRKIRYIDLANNNLPQQAVNQIIADMYLNYQTYGSSRRITVNLRNNATPGVEALETIELLRLSGWTITFT